MAHPIIGEALAKSAKAQAGRGEMPKGVRGAYRVVRMPGTFAQVWFWLKDRSRSRG